MRYRYSFLLAVLLSLFLAACGGQGATNVSGTWSGNITDSEGQVPIVLELTQSGSSINGTITLSGQQGTLSGSIANNLVTLATQGSGGSLTFDGSVEGNTMQGTATLALNDGTSGTGDFSVTRQ